MLSYYRTSPRTKGATTYLREGNLSHVQRKELLAWHLKSPLCTREEPPVVRSGGGEPFFGGLEGTRLGGAGRSTEYLNGSANCGKLEVVGRRPCEKQGAYQVVSGIKC